MPPCYLSFKVFKAFAFQNTLICPLWFIFIEIQIKLQAQGRGWCFLYYFFLAYGRKTVWISFKCILLSFVLAQPKHGWILGSFAHSRSGWGLQKQLSGVFVALHISQALRQCRGTAQLPWFHGKLRVFGEWGSLRGGVLWELPDKQRMLVAACALCSEEMPEWTPGYFWVQKQLFQVPPAPGRCRVTVLSCFTPNPNSTVLGEGPVGSRGTLGICCHLQPSLSKGQKHLRRFWSFQLTPLGFWQDPRSPWVTPKLEICLSQGKAGTGRLL